MKPYFMDITAKIIAEVSTRTCIDKIDTEVLEEILQYELNAYSDELHAYYNEVSCDVHSTCYATAYDDGYDNGRADGYDDGYDDGKSSLEGDVDNAYNEGYALGYSDGHSDDK